MALVSQNWLIYSVLLHMHDRPSRVHPIRFHLAVSVPTGCQGTIARLRGSDCLRKAEPSHDIAPDTSRLSPVVFGTFGQSSWPRDEGRDDAPPRESSFRRTRWCAFSERPPGDETSHDPSPGWISYRSRWIFDHFFSLWKYTGPKAIPFEHLCNRKVPITMSDTDIKTFSMQ